MPSLFHGGLSIYIKVFITILLVWLFITLIIKFKNKSILNSNKAEEIYIRDIDVKYSPAVLSYLVNNKIETKKDLPATLLNLCVKDILKIEKNENNPINIIDLKNEKEIDKLSSDEKCAYYMFASGITYSKILNWKNSVEKEYKKYRFSKQHKNHLGIYFVAIWFIFIISLSIISKFVTVSDELITTITFTIFLSAVIISLITSIRQMCRLIINQADKTEFLDTYTKKGAKEYNKWKNFEKFINTYSLINDKEYDSFVIWGKYLSYSIALGINKNCDRELYNKINKEYSFNFEDFENMYNEEILDKNT